MKKYLLFALPFFVVGCSEEVKSVADYVSTVKGGYGAVRDIISHILRIRGQWNNIIEKIYGAGI